ncbi:thioredoxin domain-containing protein [Flavihumibacter solisilvae]|uniref:Thioredoxin n=1 Tax=Flavihumibacter solisilvae TaxID=1349421 RepID=A0A0C1II92_9BACT|nr:thioredoxin domain-containing protein [Flavihumibacter solisilvae]KIC93915.1 hypothetical protein OI18_15125 [Flavihumibacter solisilvae]
MLSRLITHCLFSFYVLCGLPVAAQEIQNADKLEPAVFASKLEPSGSQLLDVRTAKEFRSGYIQHALQADWLNAKEFGERTAYLDKSKPVMVYCASGGRSSEAAAALRTAGFQVVELAGGLNRWKKEGHPVKGAADIKQLTDAEFQAMIKSNEVVLVDFGAEWCPPCRKMEPVLDKFLQQSASTVRLVKIDGGIHVNLMKSMNVSSLPHFFMYRNGKKVWEKQGLVSLEEFQAVLADIVGPTRK